MDAAKATASLDRIEPAGGVPAFLVGDLVVLRALEEADADGPYVNWFNDPEVCRFNAHHVYPYTRSDALEYIRSKRGGPDLVLAVTSRANGAHIGNIALQDFDQRNRTASYAIVIGDRSAWGTGAAFEASRLILDHGFNALNLHRVSAGTLTEHSGMRRLAARLGMREEGLRRQAAFKDGAYHDVVEFGLLAADWRSGSREEPAPFSPG